MSSKRCLSFVLTGLFVGTTSAAIAGTQSMLDPYATIAPPKPAKKRKAAPPAAAKAPAEPVTSTTYVTMPMPPEPQGKKAGKGEEKVAGNGDGEGGVMAGMKDIQESCTKTVKAAGSGIVNGTRSAGSKLVEGSRAVGGGIASGSKKIGSGIASGARSSGAVFAKGARAIGTGFKTTGEKMKDGTQAVGSKVAGLPKMLKKDDNDLKVKQSAIAAGTQSSQSNLSAAPQTQAQTQVEAKAQKPAQTAVTIPQPNKGDLTQIAVRGEKNARTSKLSAISGSFGKAFSKLNPFDKKDEQPRATAANPAGAVPQ